MPDLPQHSPDEASNELPVIAVQTLKAMDAQRRNEGTISLGPFSYGDAISVSIGLASKAFEIARTQSLVIPTGCSVGVAHDPATNSFVSVVRYTRLHQVPQSRGSAPPTAEAVIGGFNANAAKALARWHDSGKNTTLIELGPFDQKLAGAIAERVLPLALALARRASPYPEPDCLVAVVPGDVGWAVRTSYRRLG